jgi:hypothetical protein
MKKHNLFIFLVMASLILPACEKFLEKNPSDQIASQTFWKNETDAKMALAGAYSFLLSGTYNINRIDWDAMSDDFFMFGSYGQVDKIAKGILEPSTGGIVTSIYTDSYKGISACNIFLDNIDRVPVSDNLKNIYKGEALFLRSLFYFTLTEIYGDIPFYATSVALENAYVKKTPKSEVIEKIIADLDIAAGSLPDAVYAGHAVKGSVFALKAKIYLHNQKWQQAADAANMVIQANKFDLSNNYGNLFLAAGQEKNPEIIFSARYLNPDRSALSTDIEGPDHKYGAGAALNANQKYIDEFECTDGLPISTSPLYDPGSIMSNRDPRLNYTIRLATEKLINPTTGIGYANSLAGLYTPYLVRKYVDPTHLPFDYTTRSDQDFILLRYAEVLLIYAEAKNEASGPDQSFYDAVNKVRSRTGVNMPPIPSGLNKDDMRDRIRHERRVELGGEGRRYLDLKRWKIAEIVIPSIIDPGGIPRNFNPQKNYVFPFPQSEIDVNPNLTQNPNY